VPVWTSAENLAPPGFDPRTVQPVGSRYTDWPTGPQITTETYIKITDSAVKTSAREAAWHEALSEGQQVFWTSVSLPNITSYIIQIYWSDRPGIDSRGCHWWFFFVLPPTEPCAWGKFSPWKWVPGISPGVKEATGAFGWRPTNLVVPKRQEISGP